MWNASESDTVLLRHAIIFNKLWQKPAKQKELMSLRQHMVFNHASKGRSGHPWCRKNEISQTTRPHSLGSWASFTTGFVSWKQSSWYCKLESMWASSGIIFQNIVFFHHRPGMKSIVSDNTPYKHCHHAIWVCSTTSAIIIRLCKV